MHSALKRLVEANAQLLQAQQTLETAQDHRRTCALQLSEIADENERWQAALFAYRNFGKGLSLALAEAATGLPGRRAQSTFLVRAGRKEHQPKGHGGEAPEFAEPMTEWPAPDALEQELIRSHIAHGQPYWIDKGLGWGNVRTELDPDEAEAYLQNPTAAMARKASLSREDFVEWLSTEGFVRCEGLTRSGARCKSGVAGVSSQLPVKLWKKAKEKGGYCSRHGGQASA